MWKFFQLQFRVWSVILPLLAQDVSLTIIPKAYPDFGRTMRSEFLHDPTYTPLNHGAYGTFPKTVHASLSAFQSHIESNADHWIRVGARPALDSVRTRIASLLSSDPDDLVVVPNTTSGINAILRSLLWAHGDQILHFSTVYGSMKSLIDYISDTHNGSVTSLSFPVTYPVSNTALIQAFRSFVSLHHKPESGSPIRLALFDHITSVPHVINPIEEFIPFLKSLGILVLIDGAHAVGQVPINLTSLSPDYYITNAHKWLYAARSCALLYVAKERQSGIHPAIISSNYAQNGSRFQDEFFWTGTIDYAPYMTIPAALEFREAIGGEIEIMRYTHNLAREGGAYLANLFGTRVLQEESQMGSCIDVELPIVRYDHELLVPGYWDRELFVRKLFTGTYQHGGAWWIRVSAQIYNDMTDFVRAGQVYEEICGILNNHTADGSGAGTLRAEALGGVVALSYLKSHADL